MQNRGKDADCFRNECILSGKSLFGIGKTHQKSFNAVDQKTAAVQITRQDKALEKTGHFNALKSRDGTDKLPVQIAGPGLTA